jgi:hypothetical protein
VSRDRAAVVGAGIAGMAAAETLSSSCDVVVYDRLPMPGGVLPFDHPAVTALAQRCSKAGVLWKLGTTAVRWNGRQLMSVGPGGICWEEADLLIYAGGSRPATLAELAVAGPRLAGVYPAPVAIHLAEAKVVLGYRVVIIGSGHWARRVREAVAGHARTVILVSEVGSPGRMPEGDFPNDQVLEGWRPLAVEGTGRVDRLVLGWLGQRYRIGCDAVILAGSCRPLRNVDGAVTEPAHNVCFVQPLGEHLTHDEVAEHARETVSARVNRASMHSEVGR